jgi:hypothetical protein
VLLLKDVLLLVLDCNRVIKLVKYLFFTSDIVIGCGYIICATKRM